MLAIVVNRVGCDNTRPIVEHFLACIAIGIPLGEAAARNGQPGPVAFLEDVCDRMDTDSEGINHTWFHEYRFLVPISISRTEKGLAKMLSEPGWMNVDERNDPVCVHGGRGSKEFHARKAGNLHIFHQWLSRICKTLLVGKPVVLRSRRLDKKISPHCRNGSCWIVLVAIR